VSADLVAAGFSLRCLRSTIAPVAGVPAVVGVFGAAFVGGDPIGKELEDADANQNGDRDGDGVARQGRAAVAAFLDGATCPAAGPSAGPRRGRQAQDRQDGRNEE